MRSRINELRQKYLTVLDLAPELDVRIDAVEMSGNKLRIVAEAPSQEMKNRMWDQITTVDPTFSDLLCEISVSAAVIDDLVSRARIDEEAAAAHERITYTVQPGDTLESISHLFYGDSRKAKKILEANPDQVGDPWRLEPGTVLEIPA